MRRSALAAQWEQQGLEAPCTSDPSARPASRPLATAWWPMRDVQTLYPGDGPLTNGPEARSVHPSAC